MKSLPARLRVATNNALVLGGGARVGTWFGTSGDNVALGDLRTRHQVAWVIGGRGTAILTTATHAAFLVAPQIPPGDGRPAWRAFAWARIARHTRRSRLLHHHHWRRCHLRHHQRLNRRSGHLNRGRDCHRSGDHRRSDSRGSKARRAAAEQVPTTTRASQTTSRHSSQGQ